MALVKCVECGAHISNQAFTCPHCGKPLQANSLCGWEYRSQAMLFGLPLVHIAYGIDTETGRKRIAKGIIAIGDVAVGMLALGGAAFGIIALGGCALGLLSLGGVALGLILAIGGCALGGMALGGVAIGGVAFGGMAVGYFAIGGGTWGVHALGGNAHDPEALEFFRDWLGSWVDSLGQR
jgi:hypothetical protein